LLGTVEYKADQTCPICCGPMMYFIEKRGLFVQSVFQLLQCTRCDFISVVNPITDLSEIYNEAYYEGRGADPLVDYAFELEHPEQTVRIFEWRGILEAVRHHYGPEFDGVRWLDYGSGAGGLVRFLRGRNVEAYGFDVGGFANRALARGVQNLTLSELDDWRDSFDVISVIEVLEHIHDPVPFLQSVGQLLRPGGLLFLTTGNADPHRRSFASWGYVIPEVHISYFSPESLGRALEQAGFQAFPLGRSPGLKNIISYKILKTLGLKRTSPLLSVLPWSLISYLTDWFYQLSAVPIATRRWPHQDHAYDHSKRAGGSSACEGS
jgi:2-polyprenyl-3-methyl-5-hydroxy-6-metoxy-1,4-benzoquinol methylase